MGKPASRSLFVEPGPFFGPQKKRLEARGSQVRVLVTLFLNLVTMLLTSKRHNKAFVEDYCHGLQKFAA